jgi:hypothetical protein
MVNRGVIPQMDARLPSPIHRTITVEAETTLPLHRVLQKNPLNC